MRKLRVRGLKSNDAEYSVMVNHNMVEQGPGELFSFYTSPTFHGSVDVTITVRKGHITLVGCTVTYPATFNNTIEGTVTFLQPIQEPMAVIENQTIRTVPWGLQINAGEEFSYKHLMFNGAPKVNLQIRKIDLLPGIDFFIGNVLDGRIIKNVTVLDYHYQPDYLPNDVNSTQDLEDLKKLVLENCSS